MASVNSSIGTALKHLRSAFLDVKKDRFSCHHANLSSLSEQCSSEEIPILLESLPDILTEAQSEWESSGVRAVWVTVPLKLSALISPLALHRFVYHHVTAPHHVVMTAWLSSDPNNLPPYANHSVGVAGLVIREDNNSVLVIQERYYPKVGGLPYWKFPGGLADVGEDFGRVAERETREETGVDAEFVTLLAARHLHHFRWDISDIYIACLLRLKDDKDVSIRHDPGEIANCCWMDIDEFSARPNCSPLNKHIIECYREYKRTGVSIHTQEIPSLIATYSHTVYSAETKHLPDVSPGNKEERACL